MLGREALEAMLAEGCSLEEIGRRVERHPSTVSYWLRKHGLTPNGARSHASRGGIDREELAALLDAGLSLREIAARLGCGYSTVRHWMSRHGLSPRPWVAREAELTTHCEVHGPGPHVTRSDGYARCQRCRSEAVSRRRRSVKQLLVAEAGGGCALCGYDRCVAALHFHHLDPGSKRFSVGVSSTRSLAALREEAAKCVLLCANCHAEVEAGVSSLS